MPVSSHHHRAFTLLEVVITLTILSMIMLSVSALMRGSLDMRRGVSEKYKVISRLNIALETLKRDIEHAYLLSINDDSTLMGDNAINYTYFRVTSFADSTQIQFTAMKREASLDTGAARGELTRIHYELKDSPQFSNRQALYRQTLGVGFESEPQPTLIVEGIRFLRLELWNGQAWVQEWDSDKTEYKEKLPHMVRITLRSHLHDPDPTQDPDTTPPTTEGSPEEWQQSERRTIIHIPWAKRFPEIKDKPKTLRFE